MIHQNLMGFITKSPIKNEYILGPIYSLTKEESKGIIEAISLEIFCKNIEEENIHNVPIEVIFDYLRILPVSFYDSQYLYSFDIFEVSDYFAFDHGQSRDNKMQLAIICYDKSSNIIVNKIVLGSYSQSNFMSNLNNKDLYKPYLKIELFYQSIQFLTENEKLKVFYDFDFDKYRYFLESVDLNDYIFTNTDEWFDVFDLNYGFLHYSYINA